MSQTGLIKSNVPDRLRFMLEEANQACGDSENAKKNSKVAKGHAKKAVELAYSEAIKEGFSPRDAKELLFSSVTTISRRALYMYLPDEAKDKEMQALARKRNENRNVASLQLAATNKSAVALMRQKGKHFEASNIPQNFHNPGAVSLKNELAIEISSALKKDGAAHFLLTHDGKVVISVDIQGSSKPIQEMAAVK